MKDSEYITTKLFRYEHLMELFICCSNTSTINLLTNLRFLPDKIVLDLKELQSAAPFQNEWQWSHKAACQLRKLCLFMTTPSLSLCWTTLELIKLRDELDCCDIPATFFYIKFIVTRTLFFSPSSPSLFPCLFSLSLIKPGRSRQRLELSAGRGGAVWSR